MNRKWMLYGANGYTGERVAREAARTGKRPILAGRNKPAIATLANQLDLEYRIFDLENETTLNDQLADVALILNCAGPFTQTAKALVEACLSVGCHYLDISGELSVFEYCFNQNARAEQAGCIICPGVAFDIVPTEAAAAKLKQLLPNAESLKLGFDGKMALSKGSSITLLEGIGNPELSVFMVREQGEIKHLAKPHIASMSFEPDQPPRSAMAITWADLNGAFYSTQIPNIAVYIPATLVNRMSFAGMARLQPVFQRKWIQKFFGKIIKALVKGPSTRELETGHMTISGEARSADGKTVRIHFTVAHGYKFTYLSALAIAEHCLTKENRGGYFTPSMLMGTDFVETIAGSSAYQIEQPFPTIDEMVQEPINS